jgi:transposase
MSNFRQIDRETGFLMPPSVDEWLPERHLARFIVEVIAGLDLRSMSGSYRGSGSASYHPRILLGLLVYGYATGVFSSRKIERATYNSVAFRFIAANDHPDHDTIATFRFVAMRLMTSARQLLEHNFQINVGNAVNNIANGGLAPPLGFSLGAAMGSALRPWPISMFSRGKKTSYLIDVKGSTRDAVCAVHESVQARIRPCGHLGEAARVGSNRQAHPRDPPG